MPGFDRTGPEGRGQGTGRGEGGCFTDFTKGSCGGTPQVGNVGDPKGLGLGRGRGRGSRGRGLRSGRGRGRRSSLSDGD